jgi:hypothetical protein
VPGSRLGFFGYYLMNSPRHQCTGLLKLGVVMYVIYFHVGEFTKSQANRTLLFGKKNIKTFVLEFKIVIDNIAALRKFQMQRIVPKKP